MSDSHKHHHHHHRRHSHDAASIFKERSLKEIQLRKSIEKYLKVALCVLALIMALAVVFVYKFL